MSRKQWSELKMVHVNVEGSGRVKISRMGIGENSEMGKPYHSK